MVNEKGKGRANLIDEDAGGKRTDGPSDASSVFSRVAASASGLAQSAFSNPNHNEINETAAAALSGSGKAQPSSSSQKSTWAESSKVHKLDHSSGGVRSFTGGHSAQHAQQAEDEFSSFLDGVDPVTSVPSEVVGGGNVTGGGLEMELGSAWERSKSSKNFSQASNSVYRTVTEQEHHDGEDVLAMLSQPSELYAPFEAPGEEDENYDWGLSEEQLSELRAITKELFPQPVQHGSKSPNNPLNLLPQNESITGLSQTNNTLNGVLDVVNREQWEGVLTRYADEVWGGLLPLVKEAILEMKDLPNEICGDQPKALRRLGAILGHLQRR